jgi:AcrR family transcriptional regulator
LTSPDCPTTPLPARRKNDPEGMRQRILDAAQNEFVQHGFSGARLDNIAEQANTNKRMVVYHFHSKKELYIAVLERVYGEIRDIEKQLQLQGLPPREAMALLTGFTFDYHHKHPDFCRLVSIENIHQARHIADSDIIRQRNRSVIEVVEGILARGIADQVFHAQADAIDVHMLISSLCFYRVSNRHTFACLFGRDLTQPEHAARHRQIIIDTVLAYLQQPPA